MLFRLARIYRPLPGLKSAFIRRFSSDLFIFGLHLASHRNSTSVALARLHSQGATAHGISHRFNAQPMTIQKYHCPRAPHRRTVYAVRFPWLWLRPCLGSSMCGSRLQESKRRIAIQLSRYMTQEPRSPRLPEKQEAPQPLLRGLLPALGGAGLLPTPRLYFIPNIYSVLYKS